MTWIDLVWKFSARSTYWDATVIVIMMLPSMIFIVCQLELVDILMLVNVNMHQHFEACLHFFLSFLQHQNAC